MKNTKKTAGVNQKPGAANGHTWGSEGGKVVLHTELLNEFAQSENGVAEAIGLTRDVHVSEGDPAIRAREQLLEVDRRLETKRAERNRIQEVLNSADYFADESEDEKSKPSNWSLLHRITVPVVCGFLLILMCNGMNGVVNAIVKSQLFLGMPDWGPWCFSLSVPLAMMLPKIGAESVLSPPAQKRFHFFVFWVALGSVACFVGSLWVIMSPVVMDANLGSAEMIEALNRVQGVESSRRSFFLGSLLLMDISVGAASFNWITRVITSYRTRAVRPEIVLFDLRIEALNKEIDALLEIRGELLEVIAKTESERAVREGVVKLEVQKRQKILGGKNRAAAAVLVGAGMLLSMVVDPASAEEVTVCLQPGYTAEQSAQLDKGLMRIYLEVVKQGDSFTILDGSTGKRLAPTIKLPKEFKQPGAARLKYRPGLVTVIKWREFLEKHKGEEGRLNLPAAD